MSLKTFSICTSELLPSLEDRQNDYIYFVYDKMQLFFGKSFYSDPFCIVENIPEDNLMEGMLYITLDGNIKTYYDGDLIDIATIESEDQTEILLAAGTTYFEKAEYRYLDLQTRTLILPFQNGSYQLSVSMMENLIIDENTRIVFDQNTEEFVISGSTIDDDSGNVGSLDGYSGTTTNSISTTVSGNTVKAELILSTEEGNLLQVLGNGVYATTNNLASKEEVEHVKLVYNNYKSSIEALMNQLRRDMDDNNFNISKESLASMVLEALENYNPTLVGILAQYDIIKQQIGYIEQAAKEYADESFNNSKNEIIDYINTIPKSWSSFEYGNDRSDYLTDEEAKVIADALEEARQKIIDNRDIVIGDTEDFSFWYIMNEDGFSGGETLYPSELEIISEQTGETNYSRIAVLTEKSDEDNFYMYRLANIAKPIHGTVLLSNGWYTWDGTSAINIENNKKYYLAEVDTEFKCVKLGTFIAETIDDIPEELGVIDVVPVLDFDEENVTIFTNPPLIEGNQYLYKEATTVPKYNKPVSNSYQLLEDSIPVEGNNLKIFSIVECSSDSDLRKAKRFGILRVDKDAGMLKGIQLTSEEGEDPLSTIINTPSISASHTYLYKKGLVNFIPCLNTSLDGNEDWVELEDSIILDDFNDSLVIAEVDADYLVKKVGSISPIANDILDAELKGQYEYPNNNILEYESYPDTLIYYKEIESEDDFSRLPYGTTFDSEEYTLYNNMVEVSEDSIYEFVEVLDDTNIIRRMGCFTADILSILDLNISVNSFSRLVSDDEYEYSIEIDSIEDDENDVINSNLCNYYYSLSTTNSFDTYNYGQEYTGQTDDIIDFNNLTIDITSNDDFSNNKYINIVKVRTTDNIVIATGVSTIPDCEDI